jgi:aminoglycoside phosphotransferase (APT) family kinase protein
VAVTVGPTGGAPGRSTLRRMSVGIDEVPVTRWFEEHVPGATGPLSFALIAGGRSNLTFRVDDASGHTWALRRPPTGHVLASAHDMSREYRVISAMRHNPGVPVPDAIAFCADPAVTGAPFTVMSFVDGLVVHDTATALQLDETVRWRAARSLTDVLLALHEPDPTDLGLDDFGRRDGYLARQLKRWHGQFQQSRQREVPALDEAHRRLAAAMPEQQAVAVVHGDYRLENVVIGPGGPLRAVLDWELCTLGDPLADLAQLLVYWADPDDLGTRVPASSTMAGGFPDRAQLAAWYGEGSRLDLSVLPYYIAFGYWRLACILEGVYSRYLGGAGGGDQSDATVFASQVPLLAQTALDSLG